MTVSRVVFMGTGTFAEPTLRTLLERPGLVVGVVTQPDRAVGTRTGATRQVGTGIKTIAEAAGVPVAQPESVNTPEGMELLRKFRPDLLVVAAYGQILAKEVLEAAPLGGINVHASLLPKYRGAAPVAWAIDHGETRTGVTIIRMTTGLDAGDMLAQEALDILPEETAGELEARLAPLGARLALEVIDRMRAGPVPGVKQDPARVTRAPKLKKEHGLIDWEKSADQVCRQIRAMQPWPTAYTWLHRAGHPPQRLIVTRAGVVPVPEEILMATAGRIVPPLDGGSLWVAAGDAAGLVEIREIQPAGKRRMSAAEFLRGHPVQLGDRFGPEVLA